MFRKLKILLVLLIADSAVNFRVLACSNCMSKVIAESFENDNVVPDIVSKAPAALATVKYPTVEINLGNRVNPLQALIQPNVTWQAEPDQYYTLVMVGDIIPGLAPSNIPIVGSLGGVLHWLVVNIPYNNVKDGQVLSAYLPPLPPPGLGRYHYVFLIYKQLSKQEFHELGIPGIITLNAVPFSLSSFVKRYNFSDPLAGNFFLSTFVDNIID